MADLVLIRADASVSMGTGHVMRCLTLADALKAAGPEVHFASQARRGHYFEEILNRGHVLHRLPFSHDHKGQLAALVAALGGRRPKWLVVDHYEIDADSLSEVRPHVGKVLVIDDLGDRPLSCDLLVDQNLGASPEKYRGLVPEACRLLLGTRFAILRPEFADLHARPKPPPTRQWRVLISLGGSDPRNQTLKALRAVSAVRAVGCAVDVVVGSAYPFLDDLRGVAGEIPFRCTIHRSAPAMAGLMAGSHCSIGAAGTTTWERCCLGLPTLMLVLADNQRAIARAVSAAGAGVDLGWYEDVSEGAIRDALQGLLDDPGRVAAMGAAARALVDGQGTIRVLAAMGVARALEAFRLRLASWDDAFLLWQWANDPGTRAVSFHGSAIAWEEHCAWLKGRLADSRCRIFVGEVDGEPVGQIRLEERADGWEISISVAPEARGQGLGGLLLASGIERLSAMRDPMRFLARVRKGNEASARLFTSAGFRGIKTEGPDVLVFERAIGSRPGG